MRVGAGMMARRRGIEMKAVGMTVLILRVRDFEVTPVSHLGHLQTPAPNDR